MSNRIPLVVLFAVSVCGAHGVSAQTDLSTLVGPPAPMRVAVGEATAVAIGPNRAEEPWWVAEGRTCDGCPWRRPGHALLQTTYVNVLYGLANLGRGQVTARITPATWWDNMQHGWVWDLDDFVVNQFGHPYQGSNYFNTGRGNGLNFWESAGVTAFGSATWEYYGETNKAALNDFINTTLGGIALGEMFHRTAWLVRRPETPSLGREIAAAAIDPLTGLNRFLSGDAGRASRTPAELVPSSLGGLVSAGVLWQGSNTRAVESTGKPFVDMDLLYGDATTGRSRTPYDAFVVRMRLGGGAGISSARVRGRLVGQPLGNSGVQLTVTQNYDFDKNAAYEYGAQSFEVRLGVEPHLSSNVTVLLIGGGGVTALGAVDSRPLEEPDPIPEESDAGQGISEGPRTFDYGPGTIFSGLAAFRYAGREFAAIRYEGRHLYVVDGVPANHLLQRVGVERWTPKFGQLAKVGSRPRRRSLACHGRDGVIRLS